MNRPIKIASISIIFVMIVIGLIAVTSKKVLIETTTTLNTEKLITGFLIDEKKSNQKFEGKIMKVKGKIDTITFLNNTNTIILKGYKNSGIICDFGKQQTTIIKKLQKNDTVTIRGIYKGFLKDIVLLDCALLNTKTNE